MNYSELNSISKEQLHNWKQEKKEEKMQRRVEMKLREEQLKQQKKDEQKQREEQLKEDKLEFVKGFIIDHYDVTSNPNDKVQSSLIGYEINQIFYPSINSKIIKDAILSIQGISSKKSHNHYFCGLKQK